MNMFKKEYFLIFSLFDKQKLVFEIISYHLINKLSIMGSDKFKISTFLIIIKN